MRSTPVGMRACVCVDLSKVCLFYQSCQAYGYASFIGFMVYTCSLRAFPLSGFLRVVLFPTAGFSCRVYCSGFNEGNGGLRGTRAGGVS